MMVEKILYTARSRRGGGRRECECRPAGRPGALDLLLDFLRALVAAAFRSGVDAKLEFCVIFLMVF